MTGGMFGLLIFNIRVRMMRAAGGRGRGLTCECPLCGDGVMSMMMDTGDSHAFRGQRRCVMIV